eukprot:Filipodium_phascolosomae@DN2651_c0_g2_i2.p1
MDLACSVGSFEVTSEIHCPSAHKMIHAVALILSDQIEEGENLRKEKNKKPEDPEWHIFNEANYFANEKRCYLNGSILRPMRWRPTEVDIVDFLMTLRDSSFYPPECDVLVLLYVNRLMSASGLYMHGTNWRPLLVTALVISQKVWDDPQMKNTDFAYYYTFFQDEELTAMEVTFLKLLKYKVVVKASTYAKYYYELRNVFPHSKVKSEKALLKAIGALQHRSRVYAKRMTPECMMHKTIG